MNRVKAFIIAASLLIILTGCISVPLGDGNKLKVGKNGFSFISDDGEEINIDIKEDSISVKDGNTGESLSEITEGGMIIKGGDGEHKVTYEKDEDGFKVAGLGSDGGKVDLQVGEDLDLPSMFFDDIPLTKDATLIYTGENNDGFFIVYATNERVDSVETLYDIYFNSNSSVEDAERNSNEQITMYEATRQEGTLAVSIMTSEDMEDIQVNIVFEKTEE